MTRNVQLTDEEIAAMLALFDFAVRAQGLAVASNAVILGTKLKAAQTASEVVSLVPGEAA